MSNTADPEAVRELIDQGNSRNQIAKILDVSTYAVDKACKILGVNWKDTAPAVAVQVRSRRAANQRAEIAQKLRDLALTELNRALDPETPPSVAREHVTTAAIAVQRELEIATHVTEHHAHNERTPEQIKNDQDMTELDQILNSSSW